MIDTIFERETELSIHALNIFKMSADFSETEAPILSVRELLILIDSGDNNAREILDNRLLWYLTHIYPSKMKKVFHNAIYNANKYTNFLEQTTSTQEYGENLIKLTDLPTDALLAIYPYYDSIPAILMARLRNILDSARSQNERILLWELTVKNLEISLIPNSNYYLKC